MTQPAYQGGYVFGGYKIGRGDFQPWFKDRQTNDGGEFALGAGVPLLKDRAIDKRRSELFQAEIGRAAVEPAIQTELLDYVRVASQIYWAWVASGQVVEARRELLRLARARVVQIESRVAAGDLGDIARINNEQLIAARETKLIESERKLQMVAIKLSLFYRTPQGDPVVPGSRQLPARFPRHDSLPDRQVAQDVDRALATRPELVELELQFQKMTVVLQQARKPTASQTRRPGGGLEGCGRFGRADRQQGTVGIGGRAVRRGPAATPRSEREDRGNPRQARPNSSQTRVRREQNHGRSARRHLRAARRRSPHRSCGHQLAACRRDARHGRAEFDEGDIDLVELNIYEQAVLDGRILLIEAQVDFFIARADYYAALGIDPMPSSP